MKFSTVFAAVAAFAPAVMACNDHAGGMPKAVGTKTNKAVIEVKAGQVFYGQWYMYDCGSGACGSQGEGDMSL